MMHLKTIVTTKTMEMHTCKKGNLKSVASPRRIDDSKIYSFRTKRLKGAEIPIVEAA